MDDFQRFMVDFEKLTGIDLKQYKRPQMERRLSNLRERRGFSDFHAYFQAVQSNTNLLSELLDKITINVSEFFRNPERWRVLSELLPKNLQRPLKAWSAACSTGEEPYSLAMLLLDEHVTFDKILASDIDERVLRQAKVGKYIPQQVKSVEQRYMEYFEISGGYQVRQKLIDKVEFMHHDLLRDPYPTDLDLIVCRNVLIYFTDESKRGILERFANALAPDGILFVGSTEQFMGLRLPNLKLISPFIYQKLND